VLIVENGGELTDSNLQSRIKSGKTGKYHRSTILETRFDLLRGCYTMRRWMARERRRACYSLVSSIKDIVGESFIEDDVDDQQKGDRNAVSDFKQK
jgi:hypothetical protein